MTKKNDSGLPNEQKVAHDVREVTEEEVLVGVTGGAPPIEPIIPIAPIAQVAVRGENAPRGSRLPFGLSRNRRLLPTTLNVSSISAFKPYERPRIPDLNQPASAD